MTLREVCGLTTEEIARAFLTKAPTVAQRIVRAKAKIGTPGFPTSCRRRRPNCRTGWMRCFASCISSSMKAIPHHPARRSPGMTYPSEAIRLGRLLVALLPEAEAVGLLALMLFHDSRRAARTSPAGNLILLAEQNRSLWHRAQIEEGTGLVQTGVDAPEIGPYAIQAASRRSACAGAHRGGHRLGSHCRMVRSAAAGRTFSRSSN